MRVVVKVETRIHSFVQGRRRNISPQLWKDAPIWYVNGRQFWPGWPLLPASVGLRLTIFASVNANPLKVERMRALGAEVRLVGEFQGGSFGCESVRGGNRAQLLKMGVSRYHGGSRHDRVGIIAMARPFDAILVR